MAECYIWNTPAEFKPSTGDYAIVNSPRTGGLYRAVGTILNSLYDIPLEQRKRLTSWLVEQRRAGIEIPEISSYTLEAVESRSLMSFTDKINAALLFFGKHITKIGRNLVMRPSDPLMLTLVAETECEDADELLSLLAMMKGQGLLVGAVGPPNLSPSPQGWERLDELRTRRVDSAQGFVAMWFDESIEEPYRNGLYKAIYDSGYEPRRVDQQHHHLNKVDDEIIAEIRRSRFLVADFTCAPKQVRGGVYFEAGFASGLNIPIIWTCKDTSMDDLHFDTRQYPHIVWKTSADLYTQLKARIGRLIGDGPKKRS